MADSKISDLTADTGPTTDDLVVTVSDPAGTPVNRKVTLDNVGIMEAATTRTLTNKTIALGSNTMSGTTAEFNAAITDNDFATLAGSETLTNKTLTSPAITTPTGIVKGDVGLGNVDNTSDANKPVSTATQTALDAKQPLDSDLTTIAGLTATTDNFMVATASAWASRTPTQARTQMGLGSLATASAVTEAEITLADVTTNDVSTTKHGFVPKAPNTGTQFLRDDGAWATPAGGGDVSGPASSVDSEVVLFDSTTGKLLKRASATGIAKLASGVLSAVTAPTGDIVGTTDTQTLTNKTIDGDSNTITDVAQESINATIAVRAYDSTGTAIGTEATIVFNVENFDTGSDFDTTTGKFTAPVTGYYLVSTGIGVANLGDNQQILHRIYVNGVNTTLATYPSAGAASDPRMVMTDIVFANSGELIHVTGQASVAATTVNASSVTWIAITLIGAAV